jgi:putative FmdB family regulatory protein
MEDAVPTYQYACTSCDQRLEAVQRFTDEPLRVCPECGGVLRKVFSSVGVVFKGSGFYRTDSRGAAPKTGDKPAAEKTAAANGSAGATGTDGTAKPSSEGVSAGKATGESAA